MSLFNKKEDYKNKKICVGSEVKDGLAIVGSQVSSSKNKVENWV